MNRRSTSLVNPWAINLVWVVLCAVAFFRPLGMLTRYSLNNENASHILLVPFIVAWLLFLDRSKLPHNVVVDLRAALPFALTAAFLSAISVYRFGAHPDVRLTLLIIGFLLLLVAGFVAVFGRRAANSVSFALAFLAFAIPPPESLLNWCIYLLQSGSAAVAGRIFDLAGVPALRDGFIFHFGDLNIEVARECSGIRSSMALLILAVLVAHFAFRRFWKKAVFLAAGLAMMVVKNGVRIATLTILAKEVDPDFLYGRLHHEGGVVFFLLGLALLLPVYWLLRRGELPSPHLRRRELPSPESRFKAPRPFLP